MERAGKEREREQKKRNKMKQQKKNQQMRKEEKVEKIKREEGTNRKKARIQEERINNIRVGVGRGRWWGQRGFSAKKEKPHSPPHPSSFSRFFYSLSMPVLWFFSGMSRTSMSRKPQVWHFVSYGKCAGYPMFPQGQSYTKQMKSKACLVSLPCNARIIPQMGLLQN